MMTVSHTCGTWGTSAALFSGVWGHAGVMAGIGEPCSGVHHGGPGVRSGFSGVHRESGILSVHISWVTACIGISARNISPWVTSD